MKQRVQQLYCCVLRVPPAFTLVSGSAYSSTLKMEAICSSETSVDFQRTTWRDIAEDSTLKNGICFKGTQASLRPAQPRCA
jgi:hypothetical protein